MYSPQYHHTRRVKSEETYHFPNLIPMIQVSKKYILIVTNKPGQKGFFSTIFAALPNVALQYSSLASWDVAIYSRYLKLDMHFNQIFEFSCVAFYNFIFIHIFTSFKVD